MLNCEVCGHAYDNDARFCADCGAELRRPHGSVSHTPPRPAPIDIRQAYGVLRAPFTEDGGDTEPVPSQEEEPRADDVEESRSRVEETPSYDAEETPTREEEPPDRGVDEQREREAVVLSAPRAPGSRGSEIPTSTVGELLLRARNMYARRFWVFFPLGALPQAPLIISPLDVEDPSVAGIFSLVFSLLLFVAATAAAILAVANLRLDGRVRFSRCLVEASQVALPMLLVQLIIGFSLVASVILMAVLIGFPLFLYFLATLFFAPHAVAIERLNPLFALGRSRQLVRGHIVRVVVIGVLFLAVAALIHVVFIVPAMVLSPEDAMMLNIAWAVAASFATPLITIGGTLTYFDLRARSEGYDLPQLQSEIERG